MVVLPASSISEQPFEPSFMADERRIGVTIFVDVVAGIGEKRHRWRQDALGEYLARHGTDTVTTGINQALAGIDQGSNASMV
jgi:hypothetical protein